MARSRAACRMVILIVASLTACADRDDPAVEEKLWALTEQLESLGANLPEQSDQEAGLESMESALAGLLATRDQQIQEMRAKIAKLESERSDQERRSKEIIDTLNEDGERLELPREKGAQTLKELGRPFDQDLVPLDDVVKAVDQMAEQLREQEAEIIRLRLELEHQGD